MSRRFKRNDEEYVAYKFEKERRANLLAKPGPNNFVLILDHLKASYNIGKIFRSADAFGCKQVYIIGTKTFDPTPAKGSFKHVPAKFYKEFESAYQELKDQDYQFFSLDPHASQELGSINLPENSAFIFGHEEFGDLSDLSNYSDIQKIKIPQFGRVESLNVSIAASIVMYEYTTKQR